MKINIKQIANDHNITIKELAKKINVSERSIYNYQNGTNALKTKHFIKLLIFTRENSTDFLSRYSYE